MLDQKPHWKCATTHRRSVRLVQRPQKAPEIANFEVVDEPLPLLAEGEALVETLFISIDPTHRIWLSERLQYAAPIGLGDVVRGFGIGRVIMSRLPSWSEGLLLAGLVGWTSHRIIGLGEIGTFVPLPQVALEALPALLHVLGPSGVAAFHGVFDVAGLQCGETMIVTSAAGAVGTIAGQLGLRERCRVIGIAGGAEKCAWLNRIGFDVAIDHHQPNWQDRLALATPGGADVLFENVGGEIMASAIARLKRGGRIALCGMVSGYNDDGPMLADWGPVLMHSLRVRGFQISDLTAANWAKAQATLRQIESSGELWHRELIIDGLDQAPAALQALLVGDHYGKLIIRVGQTADHARRLQIAGGSPLKIERANVSETIRS